MATTTKRVQAKIQRIVNEEENRQTLIKEKKNLEKLTKNCIVYDCDIESIINNYRETFRAPVSIENNMFKLCDDETIFLLFKQFRTTYSKGKTIRWTYSYTDHYAPLYFRTTGTKAPTLTNHIPIEFKRGHLDNFVKRQLVMDVPTDIILSYFGIVVNNDNNYVLK